MIAISSHRPHSESGEYQRTQQIAKNSWEHVFEKIVYFGPVESDLAGYKTIFVKSEPFPKIRDMAAYAGQRDGYAAILNADIVVTPELLGLEMHMVQRARRCGSSRRWHFKITGGNIRAMLKDAWLGDDRGRDIFVAHYMVWRKLADQMPDYFRIGNPYWDAWITDWFREHYNDNFVDFTGSKTVFHPVHEGRNYPYAESISKVYKR